MDQSSFNTSNIPRMTTRRKLQNNSNTSQNTSFTTTHFFNDNEKSRFNWTSLRDWTYDFLSKSPEPVLQSRRDRFSNGGYLQKQVTFRSLLWIFIALFSFYLCWEFLRKSLSPIDHLVGQPNNSHLNKLMLMNDLEEIGLARREFDQKIYNLQKQLDDQAQRSNVEALFDMPKLSATVVSLVKSTRDLELNLQQIESQITKNANNVKTFEPEILNEIRSELDGLHRLIHTIDDKMKRNEQMTNEQITKQIDLVLNDKLKNIGGQSNWNDTSMIDKSIRRQMKNLILDYSTQDLDRPDYASERNNAKVLDASMTYVEPDTFTLFSIPLWSSSSAPSIIVRRNSHILFDLHTKPWKMAGQNGFIKIKLAKPIVPKSFVYEHVIRRDMLDEQQISCSPKVFNVFGYLNDESDDEAMELGKFQFDIQNDDFEAEFSFHNVNRELAVIRFDIESNHGNDQFTCLHRIKVF